MCVCACVCVPPGFIHKDTLCQSALPPKVSLRINSFLPSLPPYPSSTVSSRKRQGIVSHLPIKRCHCHINYLLISGIDHMRHLAPLFVDEYSTFKTIYNVFLADKKDKIAHFLKQNTCSQLFFSPTV